jgi:hypothetical protein
MTQLFPHFRFDPTETPQSFTARLAYQHTGGSLLPFLKDIRIKPAELMSGEAKAIEALAEVAGEPVTTISHNAAIRVAKRAYDLRGSQVSAEFMARPATVFCPACLADDDVTYGDPRLRRGRWIWTLSVVRTCPEHGLPLIARAKTNWSDELHIMTDRVPEQGQELKDLASNQSVRAVSPLQSYIVARLSGERGSAWLDSQTIEQAWRTTEMLGMVVLFGPDKSPQTPTPDEWDAAGRTGFECTSKGEAGVLEGLEEMFRAHPRTATNVGPQKVFGRLFKWLAFGKGTKDPGDIKRIMRAFIIGHFALGSGHKVFGEALAERRLHTATSLASEANLDSRTLRNLLVSHGLVPSDEAENPNFAFDAEQGRALAAKALRTVTVIKLPELLNASRPQADQIVDERIISPLVDDYLDGPGRTRKALNKADITSLLELLEDCATPVTAISDGFVPIAKAAEKSRRNNGEILHLMLGGFLNRVVRLTGEKGLKAIYVDPDEVKTVSVNALTGMRPTTAFGKLQIPIPSGWALAHEHPDVLRSVRVQGPNGKHSFLRFMPEDVECFLQMFTTTGRIATGRDIAIGIVIRDLKRARVKPVFLRTEFGIELFRTSDIPELVLT